MADLDDFFAKKDRKKNKTTKKFTTTDEVAKKLEDNAKKTEIKKKPDRVADGDETNTPVHDQDEWKEFEEEKKDYTGLKIGNLTIGQNDGNQDIETNSENQQGDETGQQSEKKTGPWNKIDVEVQEPVAPPVKVEEKPAKPSKPATYVVPSLRNQVQQSSSRPRPRGAPDVHNEELFPTLSKTNDHKKHRNEGNFEVVAPNKSSSFRHSEQSRLSSTQGPKLTLGNRYNTLSQDS